MDKIRTTTIQLLRSCTSKSVSDFAGIRGKVKLTQKDNINVNLEELDQEDIGVYESDVAEISESYVNHKRAKRKAREQMKQCIVRDKYFKEKEPSFLTYVEKDQIKKLHMSNPEEWTPQKLSESFPALPETINKILKTEWIPDTVKVILKYDKRVIENWKKFKVGQLALNPKLRDHLIKFRDRKINLTDEETLSEKYVRRRIDLPKPKSTFFTEIIKNPIEETQLHDSKLLNPPQIDVNNNDKKLSFVTMEHHALSNRRDNDNNNKVGITKKGNEHQQRLIFHEFLKKKLNNADEVMGEERQTMLNMLRKHLESKNEENISIDSTKENSVSFVKKLSESAVTTDMRTDYTSLDTCIKDRKSKAEINVHYTKHIKIPKSVYKKGITYRVDDCYYDDDGEFLYRVPGLKS